MFDYQAGEKFKLTLIMVGFAGLMAGMLFTMLLMPTPDATPRHRPHQRYMDNPDITGGRAPSGAASAAAASTGAPVSVTDPNAALSMIEQWLPIAWDLS